MVLVSLMTSDWVFSPLVIVWTPWGVCTLEALRGDPERSRLPQPREDNEWCLLVRL